jgi:MoxR-like ATPase
VESKLVMAIKRGNPTMKEIRLPSEKKYGEELEALAANDQHPRPPRWRLSPRAVETFVMGADKPLPFNGKKVTITPKYYGDRSLIQVAIATLASDRALLMVGEPGTAKSWLSEHLAAAVSGASQPVIQGTAGTTEDQIKYTWNYAMLLAEGPSERSLIKSPVYLAMEQGHVVRFEEITRCASEVQDALISILSEKSLAVPELSSMVFGQQGFNIIATANTRDRGINDMSSALKRRFNFVNVPVVSDLDLEVKIVTNRSEELMADHELTKTVNKDLVEMLVTVFQELRAGQTKDGKTKVKPLSTVLSTAEIISVMFAGHLLGSHFGSGEAGAAELARSVIGAIEKENPDDKKLFKEYLENVVKIRKGGHWKEFYHQAQKLV